MGTGYWPPLSKYALRWRLVNRYGLFARMTTDRPEIVVQGSYDGKIWHNYQFKWKVDDLKKRPMQVGPHQPRLDWQMWFAALSDWKRTPWFVRFMERLLQGSPDVMALLETNIFHKNPPKFVRALVYDYRFTDAETHKKTGEWWRRSQNAKTLQPCVSPE